MKQNSFSGRRAVQIGYFKAYKGHIHNPGMGIICMGISDHMSVGYTEKEWLAASLEPPFRLTREMVREALTLPYIDNAYIRVGWSDVQKEAGKLSLIPEFEMIIEEAKRAGKGWSFRVMQCSPSNPQEHLVPEFLLDKIPLVPMHSEKTYGPHPKKMPTYNDDYLEYWREMLALLGERYDADPDLEFADISGFGFWGEGHHYEKPIASKERTEYIIDRLIKSHLTAFPKTPAVMNLHMAEYYEAGKRAIGDGVWVRRDCYYDWFQAYQAQDGLNRDPEAGMLFECIMPGCQIDDGDDPAHRHTYLDVADSMCDYGCHYAALGFNPLDVTYADKNMPQMSDALKNRIGYRLRPSIIWKIRENDRISLVLGMVNDGCTNPPGEVEFIAESSGNTGSVRVSGGEFCGRMRLVELPVPKEHGDKVTVRMNLKIREKTRPARFAADIGTGEAPFELTLDLTREE